jgi:stress response protein YsnF
LRSSGCRSAGPSPDGEPPPPSREEGDTLVIPVVEEVAVVVKRLVLREEVRLRFVHTEEPFEAEVALRRQEATVERVAQDTTAASNKIERDGP